MMSPPLFAVILAGGGGTRLWPVSRRESPKQALRLYGDRTLFEMTVDRLRPAVPLDRILVVTARSQLGLLRTLVPELADEAFVIEPEGRGTASAIGLAALVCRSKNPESVMACLPSDHHIEDNERFRSLLSQAASLAAAGELVTFGIPPAYPATGYGYIHRGEALGPSGGYRVLGFREKPEAALAEAYAAGGQHYWNSGMFVWRTERILGEIERQMPELHRCLGQIQELPDRWSSPDVGRLWAVLKPETVDYGIMEHARRVAVLPAEGLGWKDIGSWDRLREVLPADPQGNLTLAAEALLMECENALVYQAGDPKKLIAVLGVRDLVIVDTPDVTLVIPAAMSERVRDLVRELEKRELRQYL